MTLSNPVIATGLDFPDALAGAALAGSRNSVIMLADDSSAPSISTLFTWREQREQGYILGSEESISETLSTDIASRTVQATEPEQREATGNNAGKHAQI